VAGEVHFLEKTREKEKKGKNNFWPIKPRATLQARATRERHLLLDVGNIMFFFPFSLLADVHTPKIRKEKKYLYPLRISLEE
jgi:hypothetical protein